ncbi:alpha/beta hydrolase [Intrasporangium sp.]|uniref:alpha/beta hydrolase n=1 Tax=Intrasporangium sp. TaxID=1925024 RepID=UPI003221EDAB
MFARWWARRPGYALPGAWTALVFACLSFTPSLLPRPAFFQGFVAGVSAAIGYGLGVLGAWVWREFADRGVRRTRPASWRWFGVLACVALVLALILGVWWQRAAATLVGLTPEAPLATVLVLPVAAVFFVVLVGAGRLVAAGYRLLARWLGRVMGARAARALGGVTVVVLAVLLLDGVLGNAVMGGVNSMFSVRDASTQEGVVQPTTPDRSGGPGSLVPWDSLGMQGRSFVARGPNAARIAQATGASAENPIRIYTGLDSAPDAEARAALAVRDLERAGGFERANLLVVTTTGTGWVEPSSANAFEYLTGGDSATVAMQYSFLPSAISFLVDQQRARDAGRALFDAVYEKWSNLPADHRPRLYVFGESLGSFGGETAFSGEYDMANRVSGALFTGPPNFNPLYRSFVDHRDAGSPEIEPVYREGRIVRFTNVPSRPTPPVGKPWDRAHVLYLQHASDPITWWSPSLILNRPDWLEEPRGRDVLPSTRWIPFVTFWQLTADMPLSMEPGPGHGHNFSGEHVDAWATILKVPGWTPEKAAALKQTIRANLSAGYTATVLDK